jgi:DNA-binding ferritin-like protein/mono/diheme cytochrome c family protein
MSDVVSDSTQNTSDADLQAIAHFLKKLPGAGQGPKFAYNSAVSTALYQGDVSKVGALDYINNCAGCHLTSGKGYADTFPALAGNPVVNVDDPTSLIHIVLTGGMIPSTKVEPTHFTMPPFRDRLTDQEVANMLSFVRSNWRNRSSAVDVGQVAKLRATLAPPGSANPPQLAQLSSKGTAMTSSQSKARQAGDLAAPTGLGDNARRNISVAQTALVADFFALYIETKNLHWHMSSPHFCDDHLLLDEHGEQIFAATDDIAGRRRKMSGTTLRSVDHVARLQRLADNDAGFVTPQDMPAELREDNQRLTAEMRQCSTTSAASAATSLRPASSRLGSMRPNDAPGSCSRPGAPRSTPNR